MKLPSSWEDTEAFYWKYNPTQGCFQPAWEAQKGERERKGKKHEKGERKESPYSPPFFPFSPYPSRRLLRRLGCFLRGQLIRLNAIWYVALLESAKIFLSCIDFRYIFLIFISRRNKLVCAQRAPKKITRFVPLRVHLLEIWPLGSSNTLPRRRSGVFSSSSYFLRDKCLYL